jgi:peptidoglycan-N-acetylglucosamine deacetylase
VVSIRTRHGVERHDSRIPRGRARPGGDRSTASPRSIVRFGSRLRRHEHHSGWSRRTIDAACLLAICSALALVVAAPPAVSQTPRQDRVDAGGPLDIVRARLRQLGQELVLGVRTAGRWRPSQLRRGSGRSLCLETVRRGGAALRVCVRRSHAGRRSLVRQSVAPDGRVTSSRALPGSARQGGASSIAVRFPFTAAGLRPGRLRWRLVSSWRGRRCSQPAAGPAICTDVVPNRGLAALRLRRPYLIRCIRRGSSYVTHGSRARRRVALTFDDGPSRYTPGFVRVLRRYGATATFFVIGRQVPGGARVLRDAVRYGNEIANHTWDHRGASYLQLLATNNAIRRATGFRPCLFRRIGGAIGSVATARALGMTTVQWDVDPRDWTAPGSGAIVRRVLRAIGPGSIVVMHDGGGPRWQTLAALPSILRALRRRGYSVVTTSELLGNRLIWGPR